MILVKFTPNGVFIKQNESEGILYNDPHELKTLISQLQEATALLTEHQARLSEEGNQLWESV